mgnify:FL=1|tara:strand:+ start:426 stop:1025 length:600 start_codon:yes stop_codon:yes gene_type:complete
MHKLFSLKDKTLLALISLMAIFITASNYLVQFPINFFGLKEVLTYGAFTYPVTFLITDLSNRRYGKIIARKIVYFGFILGVSLTLLFSTNFSELISIRIAIGSGTAFLISQLIDVQIFDKLRNKIWFAAPFTSSFIGSLIDTFLFFFIAFYGTNLNWISLGFGDFLMKVLMALIMLIPFRMLMSILKESSRSSGKISFI